MECDPSVFVGPAKSLKQQRSIRVMRGFRQEFPVSTPPDKRCLRGGKGKRNGYLQELCGMRSKPTFIVIEQGPPIHCYGSDVWLYILLFGVFNGKCSDACGIQTPTHKHRHGA